MSLVCSHLLTCLSLLFQLDVAKRVVVILNSLLLLLEGFVRLEVVGDPVTVTVRMCALTAAAVIHSIVVARLRE